MLSRSCHSLHRKLFISKAHNAKQTNQFLLPSNSVLLNDLRRQTGDLLLYCAFFQLFDVRSGLTCCGIVISVDDSGSGQYNIASVT